MWRSVPHAMQASTYGMRWNFRKHRPIDPISEDEARDRYQSGEQFAVAVGERSQPDVIIEVCWKNQYLGVWFLDRLLRRSLCFTFTRLDEKRLFLKDITRWEYPDDEARSLNENSLIEEVCYSQDGGVRHVVIDKVNTERRTTDRHSVNLDINWEDVPTFGDWASVSRYNREIAPSQPNNQ